MENINKECHKHVTHEDLSDRAKQLWADLKGKTLTPKERAQIPIQEMPTLDPHKRASLMNEVAMGYTDEQARIEAERCLNCKNKPCVKGCPVGIPIPEFIAEIQKGDYKKAVDIIKTTNLLPAIADAFVHKKSSAKLFVL